MAYGNRGILCISPVGKLQWWVKMSGLLMEGEHTTQVFFFFFFTWASVSLHLSTVFTQSFPFLTTLLKSRFEKLSSLTEIINPFLFISRFSFWKIYYKRGEKTIESSIHAACSDISSKPQQQSVVACSSKKICSEAESGLWGLWQMWTASWTLF